MISSDSPPLNQPSISDLHCPQCGYNLRGIGSEVCPECGLTIDRVAFAQSQLPWSHRQRIGHVRAYVRTMTMAMLDSPRLASEVARPVSFRDAQLFRLITIGLAWLPLTAIVIFAIKQMRLTLGNVVRSGAINVPNGFDVYWPWVAGALSPGVAPIILVTCLLLLSGVASYFFHPRAIPVTLQNRAVALSYYASAPLVLLPIGFLCMLTVALVSQTDFGRSGRAFMFLALLGILSAITPVVCLVWWWLSTLRLHRRIVHASGGGSVLLAIALPIAAVFLVALTCFGMVWMIGFFVLVVRSFI